MRIKTMKICEKYAAFSEKMEEQRILLFPKTRPNVLWEEYLLFYVISICLCQRYPSSQKKLINFLVLLFYEVCNVNIYCYFYINDIEMER